MARRYQWPHKKRFFSHLRGEAHGRPARLWLSRLQTGAGRGQAGLYAVAGMLGGISPGWMAPGGAWRSHLAGAFAAA